MKHHGGRADGTGDALNSLDLPSRYRHIKARKAIATSNDLTIQSPWRGIPRGQQRVSHMQQIRTRLSLAISVFALGLALSSLGSPAAAQRAASAEAMKAAIGQGEVQPLSEAARSVQIVNDRPAVPEWMAQLKGARPASVEQRVQLATQLREQAKAVDAPVLMPSAFMDVGRAEMVPGKRAYTMRTQFTDVSKGYISGSCAIVQSDAAGRIGKSIDAASNPKNRLQTLQTEFSIEASEIGTELSFTKFGCAYTLTLICDADASDARCVQPEQLAAMADRMLLANGPQ